MNNVLLVVLFLSFVIFGIFSGKWAFDNLIIPKEPTDKVTAKGVENGWNNKSRQNLINFFQKEKNTCLTTDKLCNRKYNCIISNIECVADSVTNYWKTDGNLDANVKEEIYIISPCLKQCGFTEKEINTISKMTSPPK